MKEFANNKKFDPKSANVHKGQKHHICESCGISFSGAEHLKKHILAVHEGQKDHKCDSCGKIFEETHSINP